MYKSIHPLQPGAVLISKIANLYVTVKQVVMILAKIRKMPKNDQNHTHYCKNLATSARIDLYFRGPLCGYKRISASKFDLNLANCYNQRY
ncbi:MAG: hypothetical protein AMJ79_12165 [Phycisphaerae bacterium SM23_30]|nr:MAG: hypothetical protein AMJ79_12165 [Phycisphaerae bacterium SM23_30]